MNILFVVPRSLNPKQMYLEYPLGVGILGTLLEQDAHTVKIYDGNAEGITLESYFTNLLNNDGFIPDIVGFSIITPNYPVAKNQIQYLKQNYPNIKILAGGLHSTLFPKRLLDDGVDVVVMGEAEKIIVNLVKVIINNESLEEKGDLAYYKNNELIIQKYKSKKTDIKTLPWVNRNLFNLEKYTHHSMIASRGCPFKCNFCCNYTGTIMKSGISINEYENIVQEMKHLEDDFGAKEIFFADDIFLVRKKDILNFCQEYKKFNLTVKWVGQMRADTIDQEIATAMAGAGCNRIYFGIESGNETILENSNKMLTKQQLLNGVTYAKNAGIIVKTGWIYGLPGKIEEQYESINFMIEMRPHQISVHQLIPFPGTPYYDNPKEHGIKIKDKNNFESFCYGGISDNIQFEYMSREEYEKLLYTTAIRLEEVGYVSSDEATESDNYIYSLPLTKSSINVFSESA